MFRENPYAIVVLPAHPGLGPLLTPAGEIRFPAMSSGELAYAKLGRAIVDHANSLDSSNRRALAEMLIRFG